MVRKGRDKRVNYQLSNEYLDVVIKSLGAELTSIKSKEGIEYLWNGDKTYWPRQSPVLFPIVGKLLDDTYTVDGKEYMLSQHGFARDCEFNVISQTNERIVFSLESSPMSLEKYPFEFELRLIYELKEKTLTVGYEVFNRGNKVMPFSIGAHPGFNCPLLAGEQLEDYYIEFEQEEEATKLPIIRPEVYLTGERQAFHSKKIPLSTAFFENGVTILTDLKSESFALKCTKNSHSITVTNKVFPFTGIWSPETGAPFVCLEPWVGHGDYVDGTKELADKKDVYLLEKEQNFKAAFSLTFN